MIQGKKIGTSLCDLGALGGQLFLNDNGCRGVVVVQMSLTPNPHSRTPTHSSMREIQGHCFAAANSEIVSEQGLTNIDQHNNSTNLRARP